jgi:tripartite-type tricarboxylate transporter receptor subunit TctC
MTLLLTRRSALFTGAAFLTAGITAPTLSRAQQSSAYPSRPVTMVVGYPPGGATDFVARVIQDSLSPTFGQPIIVENRSGAGGNIATEAVLRAKPDGNTLLVAVVTAMAINPHTYPGIKIDPRRLVPIVLMAKSPLVLSVHPSVPAQNVAEFAAWARAQPKGVIYGSVGAGSNTHAAMELLRSRIGNPEMTHVPYRGSGPANNDFIGGNFSAMFDAISPAMPFIKTGRTRPILVTGDRRSPALPDVPTAVEQGFQEMNFLTWFGLFAPPGTPSDIVRHLNTAVNAALETPKVRERLSSVGEEPGGGTPEELAALVQRDYEFWGKVVRDHNIRADM